MNKRDEFLEISDFEPCFMYLFGIRIPENLKPQIEEPPSIKSDEKVAISELKTIEEIESYFKEKEKNREEIKLWKDKHGLQTFPEALNDNIRHLKVSPKFEAFKKMTKEQIKGARKDLQKLVKVSWLSNEFYQIGIKSTSTKDYFKFISKTKKRDVSIRFRIWFQYESDNEEKLGKIALFFQEFQKFEEQIKDYIDSMIFHFDELGTKRMELKFKNSFILEYRENSQHPSTSFDFNKFYDEIKIKTGQNKC